jgi:hypothetical protein
MLPELMNTRRAQVDRILNAKGDVTIETLQRAVALAHDPEKLQTFRTRSCAKKHDPEKLQAFRTRSCAKSKRIARVPVQPCRKTL